jgi:hypothetical protein
MTVHFLKSIKIQMLYVHYFRTIDCNGVQSLDHMVCMEVEPGKVRPYKNTNLQREVLSMLLTQLKPEYWYWAMRAPPRDNCVFYIRTLKLMSSLCCTLPNVSAPTCTNISVKRSTLHAGIVRHSLVPDLMPRRAFKQSTLDGTWSGTGPSLFSVFLTKHTYKI